MNIRNFFTRLGIGLSIAPLLAHIPINTAPAPIIAVKPNEQKVGHIKVRWSQEMEDDLRLYHNIDLEKEMSLQIQKEIDKEILIRLTNKINT